MPLTRDTEVISTFAGELSPEIMPLPGDAVSAALTLANQVLLKAQTSGSIVLLTDAIDPAEFEALRQTGGVDVHILAMAAGPEVLPPANSPPAAALDEARMREAARILNGSLTLASVDDADVQRLNGLVARSFANAPPSEGERWRDAGYYLLPLLVLLLLTFFRTGGAMVLE
jgi:Ca-activated chloride channel family protein